MPEVWAQLLVALASVELAAAMTMLLLKALASLVEVLSLVLASVLEDLVDAWRVDSSAFVLVLEPFLPPLLLGLLAIFLVSLILDLAEVASMKMMMMTRFPAVEVVVRLPAAVLVEMA